MSNATMSFPTKLLIITNTYHGGYFEEKSESRSFISTSQQRLTQNIVNFPMILEYCIKCYYKLLYLPTVSLNHTILASIVELRGNYTKNILFCPL